MGDTGIQVSMTCLYSGDFIRTEIVEELGLSVAKGARILTRRFERSLATVAELSLRVEKAFGVGMDMLLRIQA